MLKRTIYIGNPAYLKIKDLQMLVIDPKSNTSKGGIPVEDMAILVLDHYQITLSHQLLIALQGNNVVVISCDAHHLPFAMIQPLYGHSEFSERIQCQLTVSEPLKKQLWKQTVEQKIRNQQGLLALLDKPFEGMDAYKNAVKSGDSSNMEGIAAQYFWKHLFEDFSRGRHGTAPNSMLNYGYAILRSIVARGLVSSGLLPVLGIFHHNKYNPYCLADDIMEPYRPFVDKMVYNYIQIHGSTAELSKEQRSYLLQIATQDVLIDGQVRPLMVAVSTTTASLYKCYTGDLRQIKYPMLD
ncbi:MAG: subtype II CRISPR-associated endonuclease Cas1 [Flavobacteriaceae bacterium]|nr:MAG: subtype II CRISPR-associated endonuclease Cas1 [Flavobacteriaceae bacterium]